MRILLTRCLYKKARAGLIKNYTGISAPCEESDNPDLVVDTGEKNLEECVEAVFGLLIQHGVINKKIPDTNSHMWFF